MPLPDKTYFGEKPEGGGITYGEVRLISDEQRKLEILKKRIDVLLLGQINPLTESNLDKSRKVYSPFPLTVLTLLSIETVGHVISDLIQIKKESDFEQSRRITAPVYRLMDTKLSHKPSKNFYAAFAELHGKEDGSIDKYSDVIHRYQRNTFNHGYQSRGVYLTEEISEAYHISETEGCLYINPYSFWNLFEITYEKIFKEILSKKNKPWRRNALEYFDRLIN